MDMGQYIVADKTGYLVPRAGHAQFRAAAVSLHSHDSSTSVCLPCFYRTIHDTEELSPSKNIFKKHVEPLLENRLSLARAKNLHDPECYFLGHVTLDEDLGIELRRTGDHSYQRLERW